MFNQLLNVVILMKRFLKAILRPPKCFISKKGHTIVYIKGKASNTDDTIVSIGLSIEKSINIPI